MNGYESVSTGFSLGMILSCSTASLVVYDKSKNKGKTIAGREMKTILVLSHLQTSPLYSTVYAAYIHNRVGDESFLLYII